MARRKRVRLDKKGRPLKTQQHETKPKREEAPQDPPPAACDCPALDPEDWDGVESDWSDIQFVRVHAKAVLGVPVGFEGLRQRLRDAADAVGATIPEGAMLLLGPGRFLRPVLLEVEGADAGNKNVVMPGGVTFSRLISAPWGEIGKHAKTTDEGARERFGKKPDALWLWYLTCKECSSERNYETLFIAHYKQEPVRTS